MKSKPLRVALLVAVVFGGCLAVDRMIVARNESGTGLHYTIRVPQAMASSWVGEGGADAGSANEYAWRVQAVRITPTSATLRVQTAYLPDITPVARLRAIEGVAEQELTYKVCEQLSLPVSGAAPLVLTGFTESPCRR